MASEERRYAQWNIHQSHIPDTRLLDRKVQECRSTGIQVSMMKVSGPFASDHDL